MAHGAPDWIAMYQVAVTVEGVAIVPGPELGVAAGEIDRIVTSSLTDVTIAEWTVSAGKVGELSEISVTSSLLAKTHWTIIVGSFTAISNKILDAPLSIPYYDLKLVAGTVVRVSAHSTDGTEITADASIVGKEIG